MVESAADFDRGVICPALASSVSKTTVSPGLIVDSRRQRVVPESVRRAIVESVRGHGVPRESPGV